MIKKKGGGATEQMLVAMRQRQSLVSSGRICHPYFPDEISDDREGE